MAHVNGARSDRQHYKLRCGFNLDASLIVSDAAGTFLLSGRSAATDALLRRSVPTSRASVRPGPAAGSTSDAGSTPESAVLAGLGDFDDGDRELEDLFGGADQDVVRSDERSGQAVEEGRVTQAPEALRAAPRRVPVQVAQRAYPPTSLSIDEDVLASMFYQELRVAVGVAARMGGGVAGGVLPGAAVYGAQALVFEDHGDPMVTWLSVQDDTVMVLCTCCRIMGNGAGSLTGLDMEYPQLQAARKLSSTCRHAGALMAALKTLGRTMGSSDWDALFTALPLLLGPQDSDAESDTASTIVCFAKNLGRRGKVPVFAVLYEDTWAPVVIRPTGNRLKLAACHLLSCQTQPWGCIHAKAVNRHNRIAASDAALNELRQRDTLAFGPDGILLGDGVPPRGDLPVPEGQTQDVVPPAAERQRRRGRNMFPCRGEVTLCEEFHAACDRLRAAGEERHIDKTYAEKSCLSCGQLRLDADVRSTLVELYTLRGRLTTRVGKWFCSRCNVEVLYDGADEGLFAASPEVIYVRVFMDAILEICVIARSTMSAAAEYLTSLLRNTAAYEDGETGQVRQTMSSAVGEFSDTLVIPDLAFKCARCGEDEAAGGEYKAILADGQIASILQEHVLPMMRPAKNLPRADFPITYACATRVSLVRNLIRRRCRAHADAVVEVSEAEERLWGSFASKSLMAAPAAPPLPSVRDPSACRTTVERNNALDWAASTLFKTFFSVHVAADAVVRPLDPQVGLPQVAARARAQGDRRAAAGRRRQVAPVVPASASESEEGSSVNLLSDADSVDRVGSEQGSQGSASEYGSSLYGDDGGGLDTELDVYSASANGAHGADAVGTSNTSDAELATSGAVPVREVDGGIEREADGIELVLQNLELNESLAQGADADGASRASPHPPLLGVAQPPKYSPVVEHDESRRSGSPAEPSTRLEHPVELSTADVPRTQDLWRVPLTSVEVVLPRQPHGTSSVVLDPSNPSSPLTRKAMHETNLAIAVSTADPMLPYTAVYGIPLTRESIRTLVPPAWLNDEVVNAFVQLLRERSGCRVDAAAGPVFFFNSFFYSKLFEGDVYCYAAVSRWTRRVNVFRKEKIFIPVNVHRAHWMTVMIEPRRGLMSLYDSMGNTVPAVKQVLFRWLQDEASSRGEAARQWSAVQQQCRQQDNSNDCGVYMLKSMDFLSQGRALTELRLSTAYYRRRIAAELLTGAL